MDPNNTTNTPNPPSGNTPPSSETPNPQATQPAVSAPLQPSPLSTPPAGGTPPMAPAATPSHPQIPTHKARPMIWVIILLVFSFFCGLFLAAWYFQTQLQKITPVEEKTAVPAVSPKKLIIGTDATFQPMEYVASGGADLTGYDIDLGKRIGEELDASVSFKNITWEELFAALERNEIDVIMSSVTITDERKKLYDFSEPYLNAGQVVITQRSNTTITSLADLKGKKIAVQQGTTNEEEAVKLTSTDLVIRYPDFVQATQALLDKRVDALLSDLPGAKGIVLEHPELKIASDPLTNEYYGIVFRKGDPNRKFINDALSVLKTQGVLTDLKQKWLD